jgi:hypothetical protein
MRCAIRVSDHRLDDKANLRRLPELFTNIVREPRGSSIDANARDEPTINRLRLGGQAYTRLCAVDLCRRASSDREKLLKHGNGPNKIALRGILSVRRGEVADCDEFREILGSRGRWE